MSDTPTRIEQIEATRTTPAVEPAAPARKPMEPMEPEDRAFLIGTIVVVGLFIGGITAWVQIGKTGSVAKAREKTEQVSACAGIEDGTAALACVIQIDDR